MSDEPNALKIDINAWVDRAKNDPINHLQRQTAEITLNVIAMTSPLNKHLVLKGGTLMGLAYDSPRQTTDIDLTSAIKSEPEIDIRLMEMFNEAFPKVAAKLGYSDIILKTRSIKKMPRPKSFDTADFPALKMKIGYAIRGTKEAKNLASDKAVNSIFEVDISFNEPLQQTQILSLSDGGDILAYDLTGLIAEKFRAMIQQVKRNRNRRQDVYDLSLLIAHEAIQEIDQITLLTVFREKSLARNIEPTKTSLDNLEVKTRSAKQWNTMELEIGELPNFDETFDKVQNFYRNLPWD